MLKTGKRLQGKRVFSEHLKLEAVKEFESGKKTIKEISEYYNLSHQAVYKWIYKYSEYNSKLLQVVEMKDSQGYKIKNLEAQVKELEQALGRKQMNIDYLEKMIELAKVQYNIDIKKNSDTPPCGGSKTINKK